MKGGGYSIGQKLAIDRPHCDAKGDADAWAGVKLRFKRIPVYVDDAGQNVEATTIDFCGPGWFILHNHTVVDVQISPLKDAIRRQHLPANK